MPIPPTKRRFATVAAHGCLIIALLGIGVNLGGCGRDLFSDEDSAANDARLRYYGDGGDSARTTRESRQRGSDMGFGFPTGDQ